MCDKQCTVKGLLAQARESREALGLLLEKYRAYLEIISRRRINPKVAARCSPSDIVQETLAEAVAAFERFEGEDEAQFTAWIEKIHRHNLDDAARKHLLAEKRNAQREVRPPGSEETATLAWQDVPGRDPTASARLVAGEAALRLADLLDNLPQAQKEAICLRHLEGLPVAEIASQMDRSMQSVAGLLKRGLHALRLKISDRFLP